MRTLFFDPQITIEQFKMVYDLDMSLEFAMCADKQLTEVFETTTGLKMNKQISISWPPDWIFFYNKDTLSKMALQIYVNHNWNDVTVMWEASSGRIYDIGDENIDCTDIKFWFEKLDTALYYKQLFPNAKLPFTIKNLSFELIVTRLNMDSSFEITVKDEYIGQITDIERVTSQSLNEFNERSMKQDRRPGVVHNWKSTINDKKVIFDIDMGSAGPKVYKKLLTMLSATGVIEKVEIN